MLDDSYRDMQRSVSAGNARPRRSFRDLPPLALAGVALLAVLAALPSALNRPQTSPAETSEYAPVPPEDGNETPPGGNVAALGLAGTSAFAPVEGEGIGAL